MVKIEEKELHHVVVTIARATGGDLPADLDAVVKTGLNQNMTTISSFSNSQPQSETLSVAATRLLMRLRKACALCST